MSINTVNRIVPKDDSDLEQAAAACAAWYALGGVLLSTDALLDWARNDGAQALDREYLREHVDPEGLHLAKVITLHNDVEWRVRVLIKDKDTIEPREATVDVTFEQWDRAREVTRLNVERLIAAALAEQV